MSELLKFITDFTDQTIIILLCVLILTGWGFVVLWILNRRRIHKMGHQIPATVVKNYLDSIIQNSSSLKSSLFRGGGMDVQEGVPSVMPLESLGGGDSVSGPSQEDLNAKNAEISALHTRIQEKEKIIADLEAKLKEAPSDGGDQSGEVAKLQEEIAALKEQLNKAKEAAANADGGGGGDAELQSKLDETTKERDELKERLMEYEIIEEDLANLKRLQQENEQLKAQLGGDAPAPPTQEAAPEPPAEEAPAEEPTAEAAPEPAAEEPETEPEPEQAAPAEEAPAEEPAAAQADAGEEEEKKEEKEDIPAPSDQGEQKSAEELLSEFEKMLG